MLNRFKNALYGTSNPNDIVAFGVEYREAVLSKRIRSALTRSSSFREDLLSDRSNNNNNSIGIYRGKSQVLNDSYNDNNEYSQSARFASTRDNHQRSSGTNSNNKVAKFRYSRPEFLQLKTDDEIIVSADHQIRPIILPRDVTRLPWKGGYAECINAGKSLRNEDQAACHQSVAIKQSSISRHGANDPESISIEDKIPWIYFGVFDGHAGSAVAVAAASQLHTIIEAKLNQIADLLINLEFELGRDDDDEFEDCETNVSGCAQNQGAANCLAKDDSITTKDEINSSKPTEVEMSDNHPESTDPPTTSQDSNSNEQEQKVRPQVPKSNSDNQLRYHQRATESNFNCGPENGLPSMIDLYRNNITVDSLIVGALESAFWEMDSLIAQDKHDYKMAGGCTAIVSLFILGKLYVCNAGDSRAIVHKNNKVIPMSFDFTPTSERERILRLGFQRPEFLGNDFTHLEFIRRPTRKDLGKQILYKDAYMTGWSMKTVTYDDLKFPLVWGEGKRSRVLATIGVTRGFGDHELRAQYGSVPIKPFLTPEPEVRVLPLEDDESLTAEDVLIIGSDGLWDVTTNEEAANTVKNSFDTFPDNEESRSKYRYITAAQDLVIHSRGHTNNWINVWRTSDDRVASLDDIAVFVIPLKQYRDEYIEWKRLRCEARQENRAKPMANFASDESATTTTITRANETS